MSPQRDEDRLAALAEHTQHPVAVLLAEVADIQAGGFEDAQAEQSEQADEREVVPVVGVPEGCQERFELETSQPECW